jgi:D-tagatose-1,6-bisphosphate aldolase subunit GatZ/KbaZ
VDAIFERIAANRATGSGGLFSVCSADPTVLEASLRHARTNDSDFVLIEATSNQVNQHGGYTGMRPADFAKLVRNMAQRIGYPVDRVVLGGDHLGPNAWQGQSARTAMAEAATMIAQYVEAGFTKIHLDCSMPCADDQAPLSDEVVAERAAELCQVAEREYGLVGCTAPVYVIGTEVPVPGGVTGALDGLSVTSPDDARQTLAVHQSTFAARDLADAWQRVIAVVVQPGVEFGHHDIVDYDPEKATELSNVIDEFPNIVFEAHSTDYQGVDALVTLVRDHFAILKVGPGLTFALREALWGLDAIERECLGDRASGFRQKVLSVMKQEPRYWENYYRSTEENQRALDLQYSLSDRIRYYWPHPDIQAVRSEMFENIARLRPIPELISQYLPRAYDAMRAGQCDASPESLTIANVTAVLDNYHRACVPEGEC